MTSIASYNRTSALHGTYLIQPQQQAVSKRHAIYVIASRYKVNGKKSCEMPLHQKVFPKTFSVFTLVCMYRVWIINILLVYKRNTQNKRVFACSLFLFVYFRFTNSARTFFLLLLVRNRSNPFYSQMRVPLKHPLHYLQWARSEWQITYTNRCHSARSLQSLGVICYCF